MEFDEYHVGDEIFKVPLGTDKDLAIQSIQKTMQNRPSPAENVVPLDTPADPQFALPEQEFSQSLQQSTTPPVPADPASALDSQLFGQQQGEVGRSATPTSGFRSVDPEADAIMQEGRIPQTQGQGLRSEDKVGSGEEALRSAASAVGDVLGVGAEAWELMKTAPGFSQLSERLGLPEREPGEAFKEVKTFLSSQGIPEGSIDTLASKYGRNVTMNVLATSLGIGVGKGLLKLTQAPRGTSFLPPRPSGAGRVGQGIGKMLGGEPAKQIGAVTTGSLGQSAIEGPQTGPVGEMAAFLMTAGPGQRAVDISQRLVRRGRYLLGENFNYKPKTPQERIWAFGAGKDPIAELNPSTFSAKANAEDILARDTFYARKNLDNYLKSTRVRGGRKTPKGPREELTQAQTEERFTLAREKADADFQVIERNMWSGALRGKPFDGSQVRDTVAKFEATLQGKETNLAKPTAQLDEILGPINPKTGVRDARRGWGASVHPDLVQNTLRDIRGNIKQLNKDRDFLGSKNGRKRVLRQFEGVLEGILASGVDDEGTRQAAKAFTAQRKALLHSGPAGKARFTEDSGQIQFDSPRPGHTGEKESIRFSNKGEAETIGASVGGPAQVRAIQEMADFQGVHSTIKQDFINAIQQRFNESIVPEGGEVPTAALMDRFMKANRAQLEGFGNVLADLDGQIKFIKQSIADQAELSKGIIAQVTKGSPHSLQSKVDASFHSPRAMTEIANLRKAFTRQDNGRGGTEALDNTHDSVRAWETMLQRGLWNAGNHDVEQVFDLLTQPRWANLMEEGFKHNPVMFEKLKFVVNAGEKLMKHDQRPGLRGPLRKTGMMLAGILGVKAGSLVNRGGAGGNIQIPGMFAKESRGMMDRMLSRLVPDTPADVVDWAIHHPQGINWLRNNLGQGLAGQRVATIRGRRIYAGADTFAQNKIDQWKREWGVDPDATPNPDERERPNLRID